MGQCCSEHDIISEVLNPAREALSLEQQKKLDKEMSEAAEKGDTAKVLLLIEEGGDVEWHNPDEVGEGGSRLVSQSGRQAGRQ